jgi:hypothetical protein
MPPNAMPIFSRTARVSRVNLITGNTSSQGGGTIGTNIYLAFTAHATNGSYIDVIRWIPIQTSPGGTTTFTVGRMFFSSLASGTTTSADTWLFSEIQLPTIITDPTYTFDIPVGIAINPGYTVLVTLHATHTSTNTWCAMVFGGDY